MANAAKGKPIEIKDDANLGLAMLIAEFGDGNYEPAEPLGQAGSLHKTRAIGKE